jgi:hypothetical protein
MLLGFTRDDVRPTVRARNRILSNAKRMIHERSAAEVKVKEHLTLDARYGGARDWLDGDDCMAKRSFFHKLYLCLNVSRGYAMM